MKIKDIRITLSVGLVMILFCATSARADDNDYDGIDDALEAELASRFLPTIRYADGDYCLGPTPKPILFRARYLSYQGNVNTDWIGIHYVVLYDEDCGSWSSHDGDNESFLVEIKWDSSIGDWRFMRVSAVAHWGTFAEAQSFTGQSTVWASRFKHGTYAYDCGGDCDNPGQSLSETFYNVGEPQAHLTNDLEDVQASWSDERVWDDPNGKFIDSGNIAEKLYTTNYYYAAGPPEGGQCYTGCAQQRYACEESCGHDPYCLNDCWYENLWCVDWCQQSYRWDP